MGLAKTTAKKLLAEARAVPPSVLRADHDRRLRAFLGSDEFSAMLADPKHLVGRPLWPCLERLRALAGLDSEHDPRPDGLTGDEAVRRLAREDPGFLADYWEWLRQVAAVITAHGFRHDARAALGRMTGLPQGELARRLGWPPVAPDPAAQWEAEARAAEERAAREQQEAAVRKWLHSWLTASPAVWGPEPGRDSLRAAHAWLRQEVESCWQEGRPWCPPGLAPVPRPHWWRPRCEPVRPVYGPKELAP